MMKRISRQGFVLAFCFVNDFFLSFPCLIFISFLDLDFDMHFNFGMTREKPFKVGVYLFRQKADISR